jgi:PDZ domain-containing protein
VAPLVSFKGAKAPKTGGVYFVDVFERKATLLERLFGGLHEGADLYPADAVNPPGVGDSQRQRIDQLDMQRSQVIAAAVALKAAGKKVTLRPIGALVDGIQPGKPAVGKLEPDDVIVAVNGKAIRTPAALFTAMSHVPIGNTVRFTVRRANQTLVEQIKTVKSDQPPKRAVVGVFVEPATDIHLPFPVRIDAGNVGGPSAGLAFALDVMQELGHNVLHGHKIAATGELAPNGAVLPIGGVKQKTIGAREAGVDAFLVPAGDNAAEARKYAHGLRIIPVESFQQALHALATLGPSA